MPKSKIIFLCFLLLSASLFCQDKSEKILLKQYKKTDKKIMSVQDSFAKIPELANYINKNFDSDEEKCRAIFKWITSSVSYDVKSMYTINLKNQKGELAESAFRDKKAICMGYALLFDSLCELTHIKCEYLIGSTRQDWLAEPTGHAWNAVYINNNWFLVDATWGAGFIEDKKFYKNLNNNYFLATGKEFYSTHHPIDAIWQLLEYPHDLYFFYNQTRKQTASLPWNYNDSITVFLNQSPFDQVVSTQRRLKLNGTNSNFTSDYYLNLESRKKYYISLEAKSASNLINKIILEINEYIKFKNNRFSPEMKDEDLKSYFSASDNYVKDTELLLKKIIDYKIEPFAENSISAKKKLDELKLKVDEEKEFINTYISTPEAKRKSLFLKKG